MNDAIVVGGGPGGSTAAWLLARAGRRVTVLDSARFPRPKLCAGWVTPAVWRGLEIDPATYPRTLQPFRSASLELDGNRHETRWAETASYGIIRREFDEFLLRRAEAAGAEVREETRVQAIEAGRDGMTITTTKGETFVAPLAIGAGGHNCPVARALGEVSPQEAVVVTRESETRLGAETLKRLTKHHGTPELFAESDFKGYGWYFTKGDFLNLGIGCLATGRDLHRRFDALLDRLRNDGRLPTDVALEPFRGHAYAVRLQKPRRVAGNGFLLIGDAAGLAKGVSGEGIGPAVESARLAADVLLSKSAEVAPEYTRQLTKRFGDGEVGAAGQVAERMPRWMTEGLARTVCRTPTLRRKLIFEGAFGMGAPTPWEEST
ncbi:MAG: NAD(P)/FAD-dependent oxidoreductase [Candidatus Binatia bacterium]|nr:NAD(P)/FAD-dependent oxidoreductase [Candidatus Binatia bacterium]